MDENIEILVDEYRSLRQTMSDGIELLAASKANPLVGAVVVVVAVAGERDGEVGFYVEGFNNGLPAALVSIRRSVNMMLEGLEE